MHEQVKKKIEDLHYYLRCETKRGYLPEEIIRAYAEAYYAIGILMKEAEEADALRKRVQELKDGFEGCCTACEPVGEMNRKLREERDDLRRAILESLHPDVRQSYAAAKEWDFPDCFKENTDE